MSFLSIAAASFGIIMAFANLPQAYKIFKRKSAKDVSFLTYFLITLGSIVWFFYGIEIKNAPIIYSNSVGALACALVLVGWSLYK